MTQDLKFLAGISSPRITKNSSTQDLTSAQYQSGIKAQMDAIVKSFSGMVSDIKEITPTILQEALEPTMELAKVYCPKETGALVESAFLEKERTQQGGRVVIGFAKDGDPPYAVMVHELTSNRHEPPTRSKFLLAALEEDAGNIYARILKGFKLP